MALSADRLLTFSGPPEVVKAKLTASTTWYKGGIVMWDATTGLLVKAADTASCMPAGVLKEGRVTIAADNPDVEVERGKVWLAFGSAAQTDVGDWAYATADDTIAKTSTNVGTCGLIVGFKTGYLLVDMRVTPPKTAMA
jgi:hypothetical protein